jgi:hypothetical protein
MPAVTYQDWLKIANAVLRENSAAIQLQQAGKLNEIQNILTLQGANPALFDYPSGTVVVNASTANARSTVIDFGHDAFHQNALVRIVSTIGATPTATVDIQGSKDNSVWVNCNYADSLTPTVQVATSLTITTAATTIKLVPARQNFRYLSVNVSADTNVTLTVDITMVGAS